MENTQFILSFYVDTSDSPEVHHRFTVSFIYNIRAEDKKTLYQWHQEHSELLVAAFLKQVLFPLHDMVDKTLYLRTLYRNSAVLAKILATFTKFPVTFLLGIPLVCDSLPVRWDISTMGVRTIAFTTEYNQQECALLLMTRATDGGIGEENCIQLSQILTKAIDCLLTQGTISPEVNQQFTDLFGHPIVIKVPDLCCKID